MESERARVLIVDDDGDAASSLARVLRLQIPQAVFEIATSEAAAEPLLRRQPEVVILDLSLDQVRGVESGFQLLEAVQRLSLHTRTIVVTGNGSLRHGIRALRDGAAHFLEKPADAAHLAALVRDAIAQARIRREFAKLSTTAAAPALGELVGQSQEILGVREQLSIAARSTLPVLLTGETGTGKGMCARLIHSLSDRKAAQFVRCQPNFGSGDLVASELFGHAKGAFTGAIENKAGLLRDADKGTLFLDEVDELPPHAQIMLLEALQEGTFRAVGGSKNESADFRLISALNKPIADVMAKGRFREDFYHRIAHIVIEIPPLRARKEDIPILAETFRVRAEDRQKLPPVSISGAAIELLYKHEWPGNVREFQAAIERGCVHAHIAGRTMVEARDLGLHSSAAGSVAGTGTVSSLASSVEHLKIKIVEDALRRAGGNQLAASKELGIDRKTLRKIVTGANGRGQG